MTSRGGEGLVMDGGVGRGLEGLGSFFVGAGFMLRIGLLQVGELQLGEMPGETVQRHGGTDGTKGRERQGRRGPGRGRGRTDHSNGLPVGC